MMIRRLICAVITVICTLSLCFSAVSAAVYDPVMVNIPIYCVHKKGKSNVYLISLKAEDDSPKPDKEYLAIYGGDTGVFHITVDEPGEYAYTAYETSGGIKGVTPDDRIYDIKVYAEVLPNDRLRTAVVIYSSSTGEKPSKAIFEHDEETPSVNPPSPPSPDPGTVEGTTPETLPDIPGEDPSAGAGLEEDGIFIDVGTLVRKISDTSDAKQEQALERLDSSFIGSIPVIYIVAVVICLTGVILILKPKKQK